MRRDARRPARDRRLDGRTIIDNATIPGITGGGLDSDEGALGPLMLQGDHGKIASRQVVTTPAE